MASYCPADPGKSDRHNDGCPGFGDFDKAVRASYAATDVTFATLHGHTEDGETVAVSCTLSE